MEINDAIFSRRSIRRYDSKPIEDKTLTSIINAGLSAPSASNLQPWFFIVIKSPEAMSMLKKLMDKTHRIVRPNLEKEFANHPDVIEESCHFIGKLGNAPVCVLAIILKPDYMKDKSTLEQSVAAAIENILLSAMEHNIGSCWLAAPLEANIASEIQAEFAPDKGELVALITLGHPEVIPQNAPKRKDGRCVYL